MSSPRELDAPHTIASLPRPFDSTNGRTLAAGVHSLSGSKKRKRTEIAVAVDGESINIYSVNSPRLISSYALPPHTYFTAPPCSVYRKGSKKRSSQRFTYAPVSQSLGGWDAQIVCFAEEAQRGDTNASKKSSFSLPKDTSKVIAIDIIPLIGTDENPSQDHDVISVHEGGEIYCFSADLKSTRWVANARELAGSRTGIETTGPLLIEHACLTTAKAVCQGLLKSREDLLAALNPAMENQPKSLEAVNVLCLVVRDDAKPSDVDSRALHILSIPLRSSDLITSRRPKIHHVMSWDLPATTASRPDSQGIPLYSINSKSGTLHQLIRGEIVTYDFTGMVPSVSSKLDIPKTPLQSFLRLSPRLLFASSEIYCGMFDVKYNSIQAVCTLKSRSEARAESKKRKTISEAGLGPVPSGVELIAYFSDIGMAVGLSKEELVGFPLGTDTSTSSGKDSLLIDSIGRGLRTKKLKPDLPKKTTTPLEKCVIGFADDLDTIRKRAKMDSQAAAGDVAEFERLFGAALAAQILPKSTEKEVESENLPNGVKNEHLANGTGEHTPDPPIQIESNFEWQLPESIPDLSRHLYRRHAIYALGKIFSWAPSTNGQSDPKVTNVHASSITIKFLPPKVFRWLLLSGHLTKQMIERALKEKSSKGLTSARFVTDGDLVTAVVDFDPTLQVLLSVLGHPIALPIVEVMQAIRILVQSLWTEDSQRESTQLRLTNGISPKDDENGMDFDYEVEEASRALENAQTLLEDGISIRSQALQHAFTRLHTFPASLVTSTLRIILTRPEIEHFMNVLRIQLRNGGWSKHYFDDSSEGEDDEVHDESIVIIVGLLTCAVDAVGIAGWFDYMSENSLGVLMDEVSDTLLGIFEVYNLQGAVSHFLRHAWKNSKRQMNPSKKGKPILVPRRDDEDPDAMLRETMLPLGAGSNPVIGNTKMSGSGVVEVRSKREMGMLISRRVPKYSIERIVI